MSQDESTLKAIKSLAEVVERRTQAVEGAIGALAERITALEKTTDGVDRKLNAVARKLLAPGELMSVGIQPSGLGGGSGLSGSGEMRGLPRAASGSGEE